MHALEHLCFFTFGCLMWEPVVETLPAPAWFGTGMKFAYIAVVRLLETILGNIFIWSSSAFYSVYRHAPEWGITPVHDLNLGGVVMMAEGSLVTRRGARAVYTRSNLSFAASSGMRVGYSRVRHARQSASAGRAVASCSPSSDR